MTSIWDNPKSLATILSVADKNDIKNNLAHFVTHNLYENIISSNGKDEQLMYIITLLLKEEINNLNNNESNSSNFLKDSTCGYILSELIQKKDIQIFFKGIIYEIIKKIEMSNTFGKLLFDPDEIFKAIYKGKISIIDKKEIRDDLIKKYKLFDEIYTFPLTDKDLAIKMSESKDIEIENFLKKKILDCKSDPKLYSNDSLFDKMYKKADPLNVLECYKHSFVQIMDISYLTN